MTAQAELWATSLRVPRASALTWVHEWRLQQRGLGLPKLLEQERHSPQPILPVSARMTEYNMKTEGNELCIAGY